MKSRPRSIVPLVLFLCVALLTAAGQQNASAAPNVVLDLINYSGVLKDATGRPFTGVTGATFLLYAEEQGGVPLWLRNSECHARKIGPLLRPTWSQQQGWHPTRPVHEWRSPLAGRTNCQRTRATTRPSGGGSLRDESVGRTNHRWTAALGLCSGRTSHVKLSAASRGQQHFAKLSRCRSAARLVQCDRAMGCAV